VYFYSFMSTALEGGEGSASRPGSSFPPGKTRYPLYKRLGGPQGRSGQVQKISPPPGFDPRTEYLINIIFYSLISYFYVPYCNVNEISYFKDIANCMSKTPFE